jgi:hypothetical protein
VSLLLAEHYVIDIFCVFGHRSAEGIHIAFGIPIPSVGSAADKQNGVADSEFDKRAAEIVHQHSVGAGYDADLSAKIA